jgi:hypothetical protein
MRDATNVTWQLTYASSVETVWRIFSTVGAKK